MSTTGGSVYANRDDVWADFTLRGLEVAGGRLVLARLPAAAGPLPAALAGLPGPAGAAGLAVGDDGTVYATAGDRVLRVDGCDGTTAPMPCLGGTGGEPTQLRGPGGLAVHRRRAALVVADTGNDRLQLFDLGTGQLVDLWGWSGQEPGAFDGPGALATDDLGRVYVADRGNHRVQQLSAEGRVVAGFARAAGPFEDPLAVVTSPGTDGTLVHVLDRDTLVTLSGTGQVRERLDLGRLAPALGLAVLRDGFLVGSGGHLLRLGPDGTVIGAVPGWTGPVAALATGPDGAVWVHPGWSDPPLRLEPDLGHVREGAAWGGPFGGFRPLVKTWQRLTAEGPDLPQDAHLELFVHTTDDGREPPPPVDGAFDAGRWSAVPPDAREAPIEAAPGTVAWLGLRLNGTGRNSAQVEQVRLTFDRPGYLPLLPAVYGAPGGGAQAGPDAVLPRYLAAVESMFDEVGARIRDLSRLDPAAASPAFRSELARWLDLPADARVRDVDAAYPATAWHGTASGLRDAVRRATGVEVVVEEPVVQASWWVLPEATDDGEASLLGVSTMLAAGEPQGAVLGSTAVVDGSSLIGDDELGTPLFEPLAHRFTIRLHAGCHDSPETRRQILDVVERERPADTEYHVCRIEPGIRIGLGMRIGVDTVVGGDPLPARLGTDAPVLGDGPGIRIGKTSRIGAGTGV